MSKEAGDQGDSPRLLEQGAGGDRGRQAAEPGRATTCPGATRPLVGLCSAVCGGGRWPPGFSSGRGGS